MQTLNSTPYGYIYKITNPINGKCYIGQTTDKPKNRWYSYKTLRCEKQTKLYNALKKYGPETFSYEMFDDTASSQEELDFLEESYMLCFNSRENGYNIREGGSHGKMSNESKQKMSIAKTGSHHTIETKQKMSESRKGNGSYFYKKHFSDTHRLKLSLSHKGKRQPLSEETKHKISNAKRKYIFSPEHLKNMSISRKGKPHPHKGNSKQ